MQSVADNHAKNRAVERYGIKIKHKKAREIVEKIQGNKALLLERSWVKIDGRYHKRSEYIVHDEDTGTLFRVYYSHDWGKLMTFLPALPERVVAEVLDDDSE